MLDEQSDAHEKRTFKSWLEGRIAQEVKHSRIGAGCLIPAGLIVCFVQFWIFYGVTLVLSIVFQLGFPEHSTLLATAMLLLCLSFIGAFTLDPAWLEHYEFNERPSLSTYASASYAGAGWVSKLAGPQTMSSFLKIWLALAFLGPRMFGTAYRLWMRADRLEHLELKTVGRTMKMLYGAEGRVPIEEIERKVPGAGDPAALMHVMEFDGVVFLHKEPPGLTLAPRLRTEIDEYLNESPASS